GEDGTSAADELPDPAGPMRTAPVTADGAICPGRVYPQKRRVGGEDEGRSEAAAPRTSGPERERAPPDPPLTLDPSFWNTTPPSRNP
ncbi:hypothetical protein M9458_021248, partial [Cirrhinus mrigala]